MCVITNNNPIFLINNIVWYNYYYLLLLHLFQNEYLYSIIKLRDTKRPRTKEVEKQKQMYTYLFGKIGKHVCRQGTLSILGIKEGKLRNATKKFRESEHGLPEPDQRGHGMSVNLTFFVIICNIHYFLRLLLNTGML